MSLLNLNCLLELFKHTLFTKDPKLPDRYIYSYSVTSVYQILYSKATNCFSEHPVHFLTSCYCLYCSLRFTVYTDNQSQSRDMVKQESIIPVAWGQGCFFSWVQSSFALQIPKAQSLLSVPIWLIYNTKYCRKRETLPFIFCIALTGYPKNDKRQCTNKWIFIKMNKSSSECKWNTFTISILHQVALFYI